MLRYLLLLTDHSNATFEIRLYQHSVGSNVHYGLVTVPTAFDRLMVRGGSCGGNVALLLGIRDPRVTALRRLALPPIFIAKQCELTMATNTIANSSRGKHLNKLACECSQVRRCILRWPLV